MEEEKKIKWGTFALVVAVLVLAAGVFFAGFKISTTVNAGIENLKRELKEELRKDLRKEAISLLYTYRSSALENRQITAEDLEKGYRFADKIISR